MNIQEIAIRNITIGSGVPKICVPIVAKNRETILAYVERALEDHPDLIELRMDWFEGVTNVETLLSLLKDVREVVGDTVILFTIRTSDEGGELTVDVDEYIHLCTVACQSGYIDLLDVEAYKQEGVLEQLANVAHAQGVAIVASNHDFHKTPSKENMVERLHYMEEHGADIPKIAVMPQSEQDVLALLEATVAYYEEGTYPHKPAITMAMGGVGVISRLAGEFFGSAVTFASEGQISAPGQIPIQDAQHILQILHEYR